MAEGAPLTTAADPIPHGTKNQDLGYLAVKYAGYVPTNILFKDYATPSPVPKWTVNDTLATIVIVLPMFPVYVVCYYLYDIFLIPPLAIGYMFCMCKKKPVRRLEGIDFSILCALLFILSIPVIIVAWLFVFIVFVYSHLVSIPFAIIRIIFFCKGPTILNNLRLIWKFSGVTPFYLWEDVVRAVLGGVWREGFFEYLSPHKLLDGGAAGLLLNAYFKYTVAANPWLYTFEECFVNQWSPAVHGETEKIADALMDLVSTSLHVAEKREEIDNIRFAPHYPFPPATGRDYVIGSQFGEASKCSLLTYTKFKLPLESIPEERRKEMSYNLYYVGLYYLNPFHFVTGDVYVGQRKDSKWEHPMYCIIPKDGYFGKWLIAGVNEMFRVWAPTQVTKWVAEEVPGIVTEPIV